MNGKAWSRRPPDVANLFNPAFCAALLNRLSFGFQSVAERGLPYPVAFLALPVILHSTSVDLFPRTARSNFHLWLLDNPAVLFEFPDRAKSTAPFVREAVSFGLQHQFLQLSSAQELIPVASPGIKLWERRPYNTGLSKGAQLLGKLLAQVEDVPTVFSLFGVRP